MIKSFGRTIFSFTSGASGALSGAALSLCLIGAGSALADLPKIGVPAAVRPDAHGTPPGADQRILHVGLDLNANERIETGPTGQTHLLFVDGSTISVGPNSFLRLDKFVYDPDAKDGELVVSVSKGLFRFVGGRLSKNRAVIFKAPHAVIGIRGGVALLQINTPEQIAKARSNAGSKTGAPPLQPVSATMLYGDEVYVQTPEQRQTMTRPGFTISINAKGVVTPPTLTTQAQLSRILSGLEDPQPNPDGTEKNPEQLAQIAPAGGPVVSNDDVANSQIADLGSNNDPNSLGGTDLTILVEVEVAQEEVNKITTDASQQSCVVGVDPQCLDDETTESDSQSSGSSSSSSSSSGGEVGGGATASPSGFVGRLKLSTTFAETGTDDTDPTKNLPLSNITFGSLLAQTTVGNVALFLPATPGSFDVDEFSTPNSLPGETVSGIGILSASGDFVLYELTGDLTGERHLLFAGRPTPISAFPSAGTLTTYAVRNDFTTGGATIPFLTIGRGGSFPAGQVNTAQILWGDLNAGTSKFVAATLAFSGVGSGQRYAGSVLVGGIFNDGNNQPFLAGGMRGFNNDDFVGVGGPTGNTTSDSRLAIYVSDVASSDGGDGSDFFGLSGPNYLVLEALEVSTGSDTTLSQTGVFQYFPGATGIIHYPNVPLNMISTGTGATQTTRTLNGFASGVATQSAGILFKPQARFATSPGAPTFNSFTISTDAATNRLSATMNLSFLNPTEHLTASLSFGGLAANNNSAFLSDDSFAAIEGTGSTLDGVLAINVASYLVTHDFATVSNILDGSTLCTCAFLQWGFFGGHFEEAGSTGISDIAVAQWVAGEVHDAGQAPASGTATYTGNLIGTVQLGSLNSPSTPMYTAIGDINMNVSFAAGAMVTVTGGTATFDGGTYTVIGGGPQVSANFTFNLSGTRPDVVNTITGGGIATFFGKTGSPPPNMGGAFSLSELITNPAYYANGILIAKVTASGL